ncbi:MAG TPA: type II toxin-antitoxin system PemK/MazF family toxin [Spirochaetales bacterium]|nr:type II toxin-antitoxin system PemK/MazF family toxin [Spirochaetales bacterium]
MTRGELWWADFGLPFGTESGFRRPVAIIQDDAFNRSRIKTVVIVPLASNLALADAPGNVLAGQEETGLGKDSVLVVSQLASINKRRLVQRIGHLENSTMQKLEEGIRLVLGMK